MNRWDATVNEPESVESVIKIFLDFWKQIDLGKTTTSRSWFGIFM
jgi:hypothetical protein